MSIRKVTKPAETVSIIKDGRTKTITGEKSRFIDDELGSWDMVDIEMSSYTDDFNSEEPLPYNHNSELFFVRSMVGK